MQKILVANWKMNPQTYAEAERLLRAVLPAIKKNKNVDVVLCPPFPWLTDFSHKDAKLVAFGAQDVFWEDKGHYTGEVSLAMLKSSSVEYVIVGHSERRKYLNETDEMINKKLKAVLRRKLSPILCVGEPLAIRK